MAATMEEKGEWLHIAALGRPFELGMLYDASTDTILQDYKLWSDDAIEERTKKHPFEARSFDVFVGNDANPMHGKVLSQDIDDHVKASLMSGLVQPSGAAQYFLHPVASNKTCRAVLGFRQTVVTKSVQLIPNRAKNIGLVLPSSVSHVVAAVTYGASAFFVFDREIHPDEQKHAVESELMNTLKNTFLKESTESTEDSEDDDFEDVHFEDPVSDFEDPVSADACLPGKDWIGKIKVKLFTDIPCDSWSGAFKDVIRLISYFRKFSNSPKLHSISVPQKVKLQPIAELVKLPPKKIRVIGSKILSQVQDLLEQLTEADTRLLDMEAELVCASFPTFRGTLEAVRNAILQYLIFFRGKLADLIPGIRSGRIFGRELVNLFLQHQRSPFQAKQLNDWMEVKQNEINNMKRCLESLSSTIVPEDDLELVPMEEDIDSAVVMLFSFSEEPEKFVKDLTCYSKRPTSNPKRMPYKYVPDSVWNPKHSSLQSTLDLFQHYASLASNNVKFVVSSRVAGGSPGITLQRYTLSGCEDIELPEAPSVPIIVVESHDSMALKWNPSLKGGRFVTHYSIWYQDVNTGTWTTLHTPEGAATSFVVKGLEPDSTYLFKIAAESEFGRSPFSPCCAPRLTLPCGPPRGLKLIKASSSALSVTWDPSSLAANVVKYLVEYRVQGETKSGICHVGIDNSTSCVLSKLSSKTSYEVRVKALCNNGKTSLPSETAIFTTQSEEEDRLAKRVRDSAVRVNKSGKPVIMQVPMDEIWSNKKGTLMKKSYGPARSLTHPRKTLLFVGATGAGKTTLINSMINYIFGVEWTDEFRFKLIVDETTKSQAHSQTSSITAYDINYVPGFQVPYSLTIVDTPGFGDTRGISRDHEITDLVRDFFSNPNGIDQIDAVCFVVEASRHRLTPTQKYVFESILSIFGKDIAGNIATLITFADGQPPPVIDGIMESNLPLALNDNGAPIYYKFNNSSFFPKNDPSQETAFNDAFNRMFWSMGMESMRTFFTCLATMESKSLQLTQQVLEERKQLEAYLEGIQPQIVIGLQKMEELRKTEVLLKKYEADQQAFANFEYEVEALYPFQDDISETGNYLTNCQSCNYTCHYPCRIANDAEKHGCTAMVNRGPNATCRVCPGKCHWQVHFNQKYKWRYETKCEKRTYDDLKAKYEEASGKKLSTEDVINAHQQEIDDMEDDLFDLVNKAADCIRRLHEIALRPNPLSTPEYIDILIANENDEHLPGFQDRIAALTELRHKAKLTHQVADSRPKLSTAKRILSWFGL